MINEYEKVTCPNCRTTWQKRILVFDGQTAFAKIVQKVAKLYGVSEGDIYGKSRRRHIVEARHHAYSIAYGQGYSYMKIAALMGVDHTSVLHGVRKHAKKHESSKCNTR